MNIDTRNPAPVFAYNAEGKKHLAPFDVIQDLEFKLSLEQIRLANIDPSDSEMWPDLHAQQGYVAGIARVLSWLKNQDTLLH